VISAGFFMRYRRKAISSISSAFALSSHQQPDGGHETSAAV